ncbi:MAG: response regulator [Planctomycetota bacterium]|nr:MAG: response regulator [Planctomycetota bacterium]
MLELLLKKLGSRYILVMMIVTRIIGSVGGILTIYYINLTLRVSPEVSEHFQMLAVIVVLAAVISTTLQGMWETRRLQTVLDDLARGRVIELARALDAGRTAVEFCGRHHLREALLVPLVTLGPLCPILYWWDGVSAAVLVNICLGTFLGVSTSLMLSFFAIERWMHPVVQHLLDEGLPIAYGQLPVSKLQFRMIICFGLTIAGTALMIGALAHQRALDIVNNPQDQAATLINLQRHVAIIFVAAVLIGLTLSVVLARSVAVRVDELVRAMKRVEQGKLCERLRPTGNDELDILARQFNVMVEQLDQNDKTIRDLNTGLERKVRRRTRQLSRSRRSLKRSLDKLTEYDRLKTEFFSNVSHELRTPLTMILAPVDRLLERSAGVLPSDATSMLEMVRINGYKLLDLINKLLDFSKLEAGQMRLNVGRIDLHALIDRLLKAATPLAQQRGIELTVDCDPELEPFGADEEKLDTIISNLVSNAIKFTPGGGSIHVETHRSQDRVWISITDTGIGIDESQREKIFERFVQVDGSSSREFSGTGLGLSQVKGLVELHGGEIHLRSDLGKGSRFWFDLPLRPAPEAAAERSSPQDQLPGRAFADLATYAEPDGAATDASATPDPFARTILVVDDTPDMRALLGQVLREDYRVLYACDGQEGLEVAQREHPDLIISDVMMPHVDGQEFCRRIKDDAETRHIPFVMVTAKADLSMKIGGLNCGADDYLTKPFEESELKARVRSLLKLRGMHQDLHDRNRELRTAYNELQELQNQLVQAEKMSSLGGLVAGLAHEINNAINAVYNGIRPLTSTLNRVEKLVSAPPGEGDDDEQRRAEIAMAFKKILALAKVIEAGAVRTARIIGDLKTFSHPGNEGFQVFDLHESLDMCVNLLSSELRDRVEVVRDYGSIGRVYGPAGQLNQVFMNVLNNAQQAIAEGGHIYLATRQDGDHIEVSIRDDGCGIPENIREKIFDPFFTTKEPGIGTGLGLSLSYGLITKLGGAIECRSTPGEGTEFVIRFPAVAEAPADAEQPELDTELEKVAT